MKHCFIHDEVGESCDTKRRQFMNSPQGENATEIKQLVFQLEQKSK